MTSEPLFTLFIPGTPRPAGSKSAVPLGMRGGGYAHSASGRPLIAVKDASVHSRAWKDRVSAIAVSEWHDGPPLDCPVRVDVTFTMPRPKAHFGSRKGESYVKKTAPTWHTSAPDTTKLWRAAEDALQGIVYRDDCLVVEQTARKMYGSRPGALVMVWRAST